MTKTPSAKRWIVGFLKFAFPLAIIAFLLARIEPEQWNVLRERPLGPRQGLMLFSAFALNLALVCISFARWWILVRSVGLQFRLRDAYRLGFLAYLLNFVSVGAVGGDLFKAVFIAREQPGSRAVSAATVLVDRVVGIMGLLIVATTAMLIGRLPNPTPEIIAIRQLTLVAAGLAAFAVVLAFTPLFPARKLAVLSSRASKIGPTLSRLFEAGEMYRNRPGAMAVCLAMSVLIHCTIAVSISLLAAALFPSPPTLAEHFVISPVASVVGALPFTPAGLGTFEAAMEYLYSVVPAAPRNETPGVAVALVYRLISIAIAMVGAVVYWTSRREMRELLEEAEHELEDADAERQQEPAK